MAARLMLVISIATIAVVGLFAGSAHAIDVGPLIVPVTVPPVNVGPVAVTTDPAIGVRLATSPTKTVALGVTPPQTFDPRPRPRDLVQVSIETAAPSATARQSPGAPVPTAPVASSAGPTPSVSHASLLPTDRAVDPVAVRPPTVGTAAATPDAPVAVAADPLNASLTRDASRGVWSSLWNVASSSRALWSALVMISLLAVGIIQRMLRDALRRDARTVSLA